LNIFRGLDVVERSSGEKLLILLVCEEEVVTLNLADAKSWPMLIPTLLLETEVAEGAANLGKPLTPRVRAKPPTAAQVKRRDARWAMVEPVVTTQGGVYNPAARFRLMQEAAARSGRSLNTVRKAVQDYWRGGCTRNALFDAHDRSGAPGVSRLNPGAKKRGRPRTVAPGVGVNIDSELRSVFTVALRRYYAKNRKLVLKGAYRLMLREQYCDVTDVTCGGEISAAWREGVDPYAIPTFAQFRYHHEAFGDRLDIKRQRAGAIRYAKTMRALPSTAASEAWGPGARYLIDATILDVYLRSRIDRRLIVGRPVLYVVIDVFSRMIVGIHVAIENPCWVGAAMALANAACSKVGFCADHGIEITDEDWPSMGMPARLEADKGEVSHPVADCLLDWFGGAKVEAAASYRPDLKGLVECQFKVLPAEFAPFVPGYIESDFRQRGARDYRLDGVLDVSQLTAIIIDIILHRNNAQPLERYDRARDMPVSEVPSVPRDLWNWGLANRSGTLVRRPEWYVRFHLMPTGTATVTARGLVFEGCVYISEGMVARAWLDTARQRGVWKVTVSFDPRDADVVLLHLPDDPGYEVCDLADASRAYKGCSFREIAAEQRGQRRSTAALKPSAHLSAVTLASRIEARVNDAIALTPPDGRSAAARVCGIADVRAVERIVDGRIDAKLRRCDGGGVGSAAIALQAGAVDPLPKHLSERSLDHLLAGDEDDF